MTELRVRQEVWVRGVVGDPDDEGHIVVNVGSVVDAFLPEEVRVEPPGHMPSRYLARREAMVRALLRADDGLGWTDRIARDFVHDADRILRAIDETPVPDWAGGEYE